MSTARPAVPLYAYQRAWLRDTSRFKIGMFARQTGKTFTTTLEIVDDCFEALAAGGRRRWVILSRGERQAKEAMDEGVKKHARAYGLGLTELEYDFVEGQTRVKALEVELPGGSRITALPANPDTARGFSANVFLDEFAFHQDSRAIWKALFPVISAPGLKLRITSTPNGKGNKFYELMTARDAAWSRHIVDIHRAVADGLPRDIDGLRAGLSDPDAWSQEYELQWLDEAAAWLSYDLINTVQHERAGDPDGYEGGNVYLGVDIGRRRDLFVIVALEEVGDVLWERERVPVAAQEFKYFRHTLSESFTLPDTKVGRRSKPNEVDFTSVEVPGMTRDYALDDPIPQADLDNEPANMDVRGRATEGLADLIALDRETRVADLVFADATYPVGRKTALVGAAQWSDFTNSNPIDAILAANDLLVMRGNVLVLGQAVWTKLRQHPKVVQAVYGSSQGAGVVTREQFAALLEIDEVLVGQGWVNSAKRGQTANMVRVWGKAAALIHRDGLADTRGNRTTFGFTAQWGERVAGSIPDPHIGMRGGERVRVGESVAEVISANDLGYFWDTAVA